VHAFAYAKISTKSDPGMRIKEDLDVCRISPKMLWINHFTKFRKNLAVTV